MSINSLPGRVVTAIDSEGVALFPILYMVTMVDSKIVQFSAAQS